MLGAYVKKELLHHVASFRFWVGTLLTLVLAAGSVLVAARDYQFRQERYRERLEAAQQELRSVSVYSFLQPLAVRPPEPLSVFDQGFDSRLGTDVRIHLFEIPATATSGSGGNPFLVALPVAETDLTTIVTVVLGLVAMLLACDAVIGEREEGTLKTVLTQSISHRTFLAGKVIGGLLTLCLPLAATLLVSFILLAATLGLDLYRDRGLRILGLLVSYLVYLGFMFLLGLLVSLRARSSSRALVAAVLLWLVAVVILPAVAWDVAGSLVDTQRAAERAEKQSRELTGQERRRLDSEFGQYPLLRGFSGYTAVSYVSGPRHAVRYRNGSAEYYDQLQTYYQFEARSGIRQAAKIYQVQRLYQERLQESERVGIWLAALSPAFLLNRVSEVFSGTSHREHDDFLHDCRRYRLALIAFLDRRDAFHSWRWFTDESPGRLQPWPQLLGLRPEEVGPAEVRALFNRLSSPAVQAKIQHRERELAADPSRRLELSDLPPFVYQSPEFLVCLRRAAPAGVSLCLLFAIAVVAVFTQFARYEIR